MPSSLSWINWRQANSPVPPSDLANIYEIQLCFYSSVERKLLHGRISDSFCFCFCCRCALEVLKGRLGSFGCCLYTRSGAPVATRAKQARKPRSCASWKLQPTDWVTFWRGWSVELLAQIEISLPRIKDLQPCLWTEEQIFSAPSNICLERKY